MTTTSIKATLISALAAEAESRLTQINAATPRLESAEALRDQLARLGHDSDIVAYSAYGPNGAYVQVWVQTLEPVAELLTHFAQGGQGIDRILPAANAPSPYTALHLTGWDVPLHVRCRVADAVALAEARGLMPAMPATLLRQAA